MMPRLVLSDYDPEWADRFESISHRIRHLMGEQVVSIEHIGSTSVPDMIAKPVIDVLVGLRQVPPPPTVAARMVADGYRDLGEFGIADRAYFSKPDTHVHCYVPATGQWDSHLLFRDYLLASPSARDQYAATKQRLAHDGDWDRDHYVDHKEPVVTRMLVDAAAWDAAGRPDA